SGARSDASRWEGCGVPGNGVKVQVRPEHTVTYDIEAPESLVIRSLHIAGTLTFAADKTTQLNVGLIRIEATDKTSEEGFDCDAHVNVVPSQSSRPALLVGTSDRPISADVRALIRLTYVAGMRKESCPAIVCCAGRMD